MPRSRLEERKVQNYLCVSMNHLGGPDYFIGGQLFLLRYISLAEVSPEKAAPYFKRLVPGFPGSRPGLVK
jgi:hypothetical protein